MFLFLFCKSAKLRQACAVGNWSDRVHSSGSRQESRRARVRTRGRRRACGQKRGQKFSSVFFLSCCNFRGEGHCFCGDAPKLAPDRQKHACQSQHVQTRYLAKPTATAAATALPPSPSRSVNDFSGAARRASGGESSLPPPAAVVTPFRERGSSSLACGSGSEKKFRKVKKEGEEEEESAH